MASAGDESPPPPPHPPAVASSEEEEEEGEAGVAAPRALSPTPQTLQRFEELCCRLNMDETARAEAWDSYRSMSESYTLEGNDLHWLACALYVACRKSVPTVSKGTVEGNYVSLTRLLRCSEQSLIEFFNKMKKWEEMANLPQHFRERTERLERNFTVSAVVFKKYEPIFQEIFKYPQEEQPRQPRGRKQRRQPCNVSEVFHFCWVLFIYAKGNFPMISDDLVNSYHLLLCALDLVYGNAVQCSNRKELLNPNFKGLSEDFHAKDFKPSSDPPCVIEKLCSLHDGLVLEAKGIKEHFWKPYIRKLCEKKLLKGKEENLTGFLEPTNFGENFKAINKAYEEYVLSVGNLDERIFLGEDAEEEIGTLCRRLSGAEAAERPQMRSVLQQRYDEAKALRLSAPLAGGRHAKDGSPCAGPGPTAPHSLGRLHSLLVGLRGVPGEKLQRILRTCSRDPTQAIANRLKEMSETYSQHPQPDEDSSNAAKEVASRQFRIAEMLYYKVLETVIEQEQKRLGDMDLSNILEQDAFHRSLMACCLEVVTFSYKPPGNFPYITEVFDVPFYHFYKVIEVFIRAEDGLCREVVKHLNQIEEQILDHLAWKAESPLWDRIRDNDNKVPTCEEVMPPHNLERDEHVRAASSPANPRRGGGGDGRADAGALGRSVAPAGAGYERYSGPTLSSTRRRLFVDNDGPSDRGTPARAPPQPLVSTVPVQNVPGEPVPVTPVPGQTLVTMATATVTANNGQTVTIPVQGIANENGGITFFPVQVNVGGQAQAVTGSIQPLSAQALAGSLSSQQVTGAAVQVAGQVTIQQMPPGGPQQKQGPPPTSSSGRPRRTSSLSLFLRKVYHLAGVRLRDLCIKLDISDSLRLKIWTCFEFSIVQCSGLMMDRHLDQLLMCAIYVMAKVTKDDRSFQNIMRCYRTQPQARSQVYRNVLIRGKKRRDSGGSDSQSRQDSPTELKDSTSGDSSPVIVRSSSTLPVPQPGSAPPTPTRLTGANSDVEEEERGDLIQFYNHIYVKDIKSFAVKYSQANIADAPPLSPYPFLRTGSPRRIQLSQNHPVYISPHKNETTLSPREKIFYYFSNSPAKRLREINSMIRTGETPTKKRGIVLEDGSESPAKRICPENHSALIRRLQDVANDRGAH
ncbi:RB transcriptional corepressor like 2 [Phyllostomus discolor]|uniref:Retinoblastoma-like protein 2 n=1 Tax=Phyllostomus discolor TaxID=89673 RepID=A0A6J2KQA7_9CHIR|nr:retinoblastoma-like protein 2 [Phyllostomus discolor]XP_035867710.1 retinoblastoma-like protein 2 [Phyllostomus discolor]KAF6079216.1 RB transcriptional corepressor like 2 [Phyllostomus discolor]